VRRLITLLAVVALPLAAQFSEAEQIKIGHSSHGEAFDEGPRQKPWLMEGIGKTHLPITAANPEVQQWFDQGHTLLHSFWYYEAERAFRWALKLDPECAMCYWGMARAAERSDQERSRQFIQEAARRKERVSERERLYITAWERNYLPEIPGQPEGANQKESRRILEQLVMEYPDDIEAKALLALRILWEDRYGGELVLREVLAKDPNHPGAHHYRIHLWDGKEGRYAVDSCQAFGRIAPYVGHAQHMPGHVYTGIGMWHEAAIAMDSATRVEKRYMKQRLAFPFNDFNYKHNRNYLSYIQEQLGMAEAALSGARQLLAAPLDSKYDKPDGFYSSFWQGRVALLRALVKFERWKEILDPDTFGWGDSTREKAFKAYAETLAHLGLGDVEKAEKAYREHAALKEETAKDDDFRAKRCLEVQHFELPALIRLARGDVLGGLAALSEAAQKEEELREQLDDPPYYPRTIYNLLGREYLHRRSPALAVEAFQQALEMTPNDAFALAGLAEAHAALGEKPKAELAYARLLHVWSNADAGLQRMQRVKELGLTAEPVDDAPAKQRNYTMTSLEQLGPNVWEPYEAPLLDAVDSKGKRVKLEEYRGRNVLLIFYLGEECVHCMEQLNEVVKREGDLSKQGIDVLAISSAPPETNSRSERLGKLPFRLLSDSNFENARRFHSYDDFEEIELHSTILIDRRGRVYWARHGGEPFMDFDFLLKEIRRMEQITAAKSVAKPGVAGQKTE
jgi:peroxiredoxin/cytochrome c-type biogenesis protein CcmH/NrfG